MLLEVCANSLESAIVAEAAGADRIELCVELAVGGITPSLGTLEAVRKAVRLPVHVLIRPRSGNFTYSQQEFGMMARDISCCKELGFEGIVSGCLLKDRSLDRKGLRVLMEAASGMHFTFHRAFDWTPDPEKELNVLLDMGVNTVLSSGQQPSAEKGLRLLQELQQRASAPLIMPGGGIGPGNIELFQGKGFQAIHLSGISRNNGDHAGVPLRMNSEALLQEDLPNLTNAAIVKRVRDYLNNPKTSL